MCGPHGRQYTHSASILLGTCMCHVFIFELHIHNVNSFCSRMPVGHLRRVRCGPRAKPFLARVACGALPCKSPKRLMSTRPFRVCFVKWWQCIGSGKAATVAKQIPAHAASDGGSGRQRRCIRTCTETLRERRHGMDTSALHTDGRTLPEHALNEHTHKQARARLNCTA